MSSKNEDTTSLSLRLEVLGLKLDSVDVNELLKEAVGKTVRNEEWKYARTATLLGSGEWRVGSAEWRVESAEWRVESGETATNSELEFRNSESPFQKLLDAIADEVQVVRISRDSPTAILHSPFSFLHSASGDTIFGKRIAIIVEEGATAFIVERHGATGNNEATGSNEATGGHSALSIAETQIIAHAGSVVEHVKIIDSVSSFRHIGMTHVDVRRDAKFTSHVHCLNADWIRNDLNVRLTEQGASAYLYGVSVLNAEQFTDNHTVVDHMVPHCHSEELYKGVYDGKSVGVFNGKIFVRPQAQKTTAYQSCKSILVSPRAQVNAKPQLEIWADDVKCSHGATSGQLNEESMFYLRSRGISHDDARALLTYAHAAEVADYITNDDVRTGVERRIAEKLGASW